MIEFFDNQNEIISLWHSVFGDSREEIEFFLNNAKNAECLGYSDNSKLLSMLFLVDCSIDNVKGKYIYAACTYKEYEGRGYMSRLLSYSEKLGYNFICLIPANEGLIDYYSARGFTRQADIDSICFEQTDEIKEYLLEGYELSNPKALICEVE